jgi:hypothetical protein
VSEEHLVKVHLLGSELLDDESILNCEWQNAFLRGLSIRLVFDAMRKYVWIKLRVTKCCIVAPDVTRQASVAYQSSVSATVDIV